MSQEDEEETIGDVLSRTAKLNKPEMVTEVESYGLQVEEGWTKEEIMEHFEEFLTEQVEDAEEAAAEEPVVEEPAVLPPLDLPPGQAPVHQEPSILPESYTESSVAASPNVRIMRSPGWGKTGGAKAP